ncbi:hypothetical protein RN001_005966 [Aquatica leii]|uniref:DUF4806 domain-containing protein n=1 Tax=Aquatica leii TaxID=1421715 RepID=A0AAN7SIB3_9COLE|nr:hypothetical protein RN001_005966 [Aquatica leii]
MWDIIIWCDEDAIDFVPSVWASSDYKQYKYPIGLNQNKIREIIYELDTTEEVCNVHKDPQSNANSVPSVTFYSNREGGTVHTDDVHSISSRSTPTGSSGVFPNHDQHTELLQTILKTQIEIKFEINELRKKVDKIENKEINQNKVDFRLQTTTFVDKLPINNLSEIDEIEDLIKNEEIFNELVNFLYLVGGENYVRMVNSIMKKLLRHKVAVKFSGVGKKQKLPFCNLKIYKAVHMAIRRRHNSTTDQEIQKTVSLYLAQSKARLSSSKTRRFLDNQEKV